MLDQADRARKMAEQELSDTNETLADLTVQNQSLTSAKRKLEQDLADLRHEADESHGEVINLPLSGSFGHFGHFGPLALLVILATLTDLRHEQIWI